MSGRTTYATTVRDGTAVVAVHGDLDAAGARAFRTVMLEAAATGTAAVVVDLADVSFLDSTALSVVFELQRLLPPERPVVLGNVPEFLMRTLRLAAVPGVVRCHPKGEAQPWAEAAGPTT